MGKKRQTPPTPQLKVLAERLEKSMAFKGINNATLAKETGYSPSDITSLLKGMREPSMNKLISMAEILGCSVDYLFGLTPESKRATIAVTADTRQLSRMTSNKHNQLTALIPELVESDVELLTHITCFLIERKEKGLQKLASAISSTPPRQDKALANDIRVDDNPFEDDFIEDDFDDESFDNIDDGGYEDDDDDLDEYQDFDDDDWE
jgi:transcriptional regulator with XRE-family HTH domain